MLTGSEIRRNLEYDSAMLKRLTGAIATIVLVTGAILPTAFASPTPGSIQFNGSQYLTTTMSSTPGTGVFT